MKCLRIILVILILFITSLPIVIQASGNADVTLFATPKYSAGVTFLTITYVSDTQLDLNWGYSANVTQVMIRAKYGEYPNNIPDKFTAPSDGYLVYYGSDNSTSDTTMDFNQNPGALYYMAWAQKPDGTWYTNPLNGWKESKELILIAIIILCAVVSYFSLRSSNILLALAAAITWIILFAYTRSNPIGGVVVGSFVDELTIFLCFLFAVILLVTAVTRGRREKRYSGSGVRPEWGEQREIKQARVSSSRKGLMDMNGEEYRQAMRSRVRQRRAR